MFAESVHVLQREQVKPVMMENYISWENGELLVATQHMFTRWFCAYLSVHLESIFSYVSGAENCFLRWYGSRRVALLKHLRNCQFMEYKAIFGICLVYAIVPANLVESLVWEPFVFSQLSLHSRRYGCWNISLASMSIGLVLCGRSNTLGFLSLNMQLCCWYKAHKFLVRFNQL